MRVFACYVVSKLQRHRCPTFGALRFRTNNAQTDSYIFIYIDSCFSFELETFYTVTFPSIIKDCRSNFKDMN
jgi:hypothetical protein